MLLQSERELPEDELVRGVDQLRKIGKRNPAESGLRDGRDPTDRLGIRRTVQLETNGKMHAGRGCKRWRFSPHDTRKGRDHGRVFFHPFLACGALFAASGRDPPPR